MKFYKTLIAGRSFHGGEFEYDLPTQNDDGTWTPGDWHSFDGELVPCSQGFHLTSEPVLWWDRDADCYEAEYDGESVVCSDDKIVCRRVRLVRKLTRDELVVLNIFYSGEHRLDSGRGVAYGYARVSASGHATVRAYNSAKVEASDSATVKVHDSATVKAYGYARVSASGHATVRAYDSAKVEAYGSTTVEAYNSAKVEAYGSATVVAYDSATVEASDSATVKVHDSATVKAYGSTTVEAYGSTTVEAYNSAKVEAYGSATANLTGSFSGHAKPHMDAIVIDRRTDPPTVIGNYRQAD
ncbi:MAG: hypothetical protein ACK4S4_15680 [Pyrinomonadaceae bacterium]